MGFLLLPPPPLPWTLPSSGRAAGQLQLCTLRRVGWGLPWGDSSRTRKQQSARYLWVFYSKRDSQEVAGLTHTRTFPPNSRI